MPAFFRFHSAVGAMALVWGWSGQAHATISCDIATMVCEVDTLEDANDFSVADVVGEYTEPGDATVCGWTVELAPGLYPNGSGDDANLRITVDTTECTAESPVTFAAATPCLGDWLEEEVGPDINDCNPPDDPNYYTENSSFTLEGYEDSFALYRAEDHVFVPSIKIGDEGATELQHVVIQGFATQSISPFSDGDLATCDGCKLLQNYVVASVDGCVGLKQSDDIEVAGNRMAFCGGLDSGDLDLTTEGSTNALIHHNDLVGSGTDNTATVGPQGTDGWTIGGTVSACGTQFYRNRILGHPHRRPDLPGECLTHRDDGNGVDIKMQLCADSPIRVYENYFADNHGAAIVVHRGSTGVHIYNNIVTSNESDAIYLDPGNVCKSGDDYGYLSEIYIYGNEITNNLGSGVVFADENGVCATEPRRDLYRVHLFNNYISGNGDGYRFSNNKLSDSTCQGLVATTEYGLYVRWVTEYDSGTSSYLTEGTEEDGLGSTDILLDAQNVTVVNNIVEHGTSSKAMRLLAATSTYRAASKAHTYADTNIRTSDTYTASGVAWDGEGSNACVDSTSSPCDLEVGTAWEDFLPSHVLDGTPGEGDDVSLTDLAGDTWDPACTTCVIGAYAVAP